MDEATYDGYFEATSVEGQPSAVVHNWLQFSGDEVNVDPAAPFAELLACSLPIGTDGCGFEASLESMYIALLRSTGEAGTNDPNFGFLRADADLLVVFVTDENDCSFNPDWVQPVVAADSNKVFWEDPTADSPTGAVCWNASTQCSGTAPNWTSCENVDKNVDGNVIEDAFLAEYDAVLYPLSRYLDVLGEIEEDKQAVRSGARVRVALVGGVPAGYENGGVDLPLVKVDDPATQPDEPAVFGIGSACNVEGDPDSFGIPPLRFLPILDAYGVKGPGPAAFSICADDFTAPMTTIFTRFAEEVG
jgi:hypothetical protein